MPLPFDQTTAQPLTTDARIEKRVADIVGRALRHQLWFLFLEDECRQSPLIVAIGDLPSRPDGRTNAIAIRLSDAMQSADARSVIVVIERYGGEALTPVDAEWAKELHEALDRAEVPVRGFVLSHRRGVRWIAQDDYRFTVG